MPTAVQVAPERREISVTAVVFCAVLAFHVWGVTVAWTSLNLPGHEFRQAQTAIAALFIQRDHDFSLAYPMPVLGKPWSVPFEFPLYQWTVVALSDALGLPLTQVARAVSVGCFYLSLPAVWLLLGRLGLPRSRRLLVLGLILTCPVYFIYVRAFMMETMALMFSLWFLQAFVAAVERRSWQWLVLANIAGMGAGLVKVTTFMLYLMPAGVWGLWWLVGAWPRHGRTVGSWTAVIRTAGWVAAATAAPFAATWWWTRYADAVKLLNPIGRGMVSSVLAAYEFGTWETRLSPVLWKEHWDILVHHLVSPVVLVVCVVLTALTPRRWRIWSFWCVLFFLAVQMLFPLLYSFHDYYYVANAVLLMVAMGLVLTGLLEHPRFRWAAGVLIVGVFAAQAHTYLQGDYRVYRQWSPGGSELTRVLRDLTRPDDVLIIAGEDWSPITPYSAQRRALMFMSNQARDETLVEAAFAALKGESVPVLLLRGQQRDNTALIRLAGEFFGIEAEPILQWKDCTVYLRPDRWIGFVAGVSRSGRYEGMEVSAAARTAGKVVTNAEAPVAALAPGTQALFAGMSPRPYRYYCRFGLSNAVINGRLFFNVHPDMRLWFRVPAGRHRITADFLMEPGTYQNLSAGDATDGVRLTIWEVKADGTRRVLYQRSLEPYDHPADRGLQNLAIEADIAEGSDILFVSDPGAQNNITRDWTWLGKFIIH
ncbi:MAG TPA: hypothetical protein VLW52_02400 [Opitutaceae bacterium]|nr:hypothetical protein [Opitutaceae bacterium]